VPDAVLLKPGRLTEAEWAQMRRHPVVGAEMVAGLPEYEGGRAWIRHHHEAWDGSGYPDGLAGEAIPLGARILAVADSYDAMATDRPYRPALAPGAIVEQFRRGRGRQWDPQLVDLWLEELGARDEHVAVRTPALVPQLAS
jgi:putative two-component system response regulator